MGYHPPTPTRRCVPIVSISGFQASDIGQYGIEDFSWGDTIGGVFRDWITGFPLGQVLGSRDRFGSNLPTIRLPPVVISEIPQSILPPTSGRVPGPGPGGPLPVSKGGEWPDWSTEPILETRPGRVPDPWPGSEADTLGDPYDTGVTSEQGDDEMAHDWGHLLRQGVEAVATEWWTPSTGATPGILPQAAPTTPAAFVTGGTMASTPNGAATCEPCGPRYLTYDCKTGKYSKKRRRGKPRLATDRDLSDLAAIVAITGKGSAMNQAVAAMVRR